MSTSDQGAVPSGSRRRLGGFGVAILVITVVGLAVRVWGAGFGLPFLYHEDEGEIVRRALAMPLDGPNPYWFAYPTLTLYIQALVYVVVFGWKWLTGAAASYVAFAEAAALDPTSIYLAGRVATAVLGAATIPVVARAARRLRGADESSASAMGIAAAVFVCLDLLHVEHSHYITPDIPLTLGAALVALAVARISASESGGSLREYIVAGLAVGIAASMKYPGALCAIAVVAVYAQTVDWRNWRERLRDPRLPAAGLASMVAFVAGSPFVVLNARGFARDFAVEAAHMRAGHLGFETAGNHWLALLDAVTDWGDLGLVILAVLGILVCLVRRDVFGRALAVTLVCLVLFAGASNVLFTRYLLPMLPFAAILAAGGLVATAERALPLPGRARTAFVAFLVVTMVALPVYTMAHRLRLFTAPDTRTIAWQWADASLKGDGQRPRVAVEWKAIPTNQRALSGADAVPLVYDVEQLSAEGVRYVVVSDRMYRRYLKAASRYPAERRFYAELLARGLPVEVFSPYDGDEGTLVAGADGAPHVEPGVTGRLWRTLPARRLAGPVILVFDIGVPAE